MFTRMTSANKLAIFILTGFLMLLISGTGNACRMSAAIGVNLPDGMLFNHLRGDPTNFLNALYYLAPSNPSGWGIGYYPHFGDMPTIPRGQPMAQNDSQFTATVNAINSSEPQIVMAHIRLATGGCVNVPDPHPFYRDKIGKRWLFEHNGNANKDNLINLMSSSTYLADNPPNGSDIPECATSVVGSEIYFLYLLKNIEENGWNVVNGAVVAIKAMIANSTGSINFIMSDGKTVWAFRRGVDSLHRLFYLYNLADGYAALASAYPSRYQDNWIEMTEYQLIVLHAGAAPVVINDVRTYCPGDINGDKQVNTADLATLAGNFGLSGSGGDFDFDGDVDGADVAAMIAAYGKVCP